MVLEDPGGRDRGIRVARSVDQAHGARHVAGRGHMGMSWQGVREPLQALRIRDGVRRDERHVLEPRARSPDQHELDRHEVLPHDAEARHRREGVLCGRHTAVDGVLDRDHRGVGAALDDVGERLADIADRPPVMAPRLGHLGERRLGERARRAQIAVGTAGGNGSLRGGDDLGSHACQPSPGHVGPAP